MNVLRRAYRNLLYKRALRKLVRAQRRVERFPMNPALELTLDSRLGVTAMSPRGESILRDYRAAREDAIKWAGRVAELAGWPHHFELGGETP